MANNPTLSEVAGDYRREGYEVVIQPREDERPLFLAGFPIDLLARKDDGNAVVVVRRNRTALRGDARLIELGRVLEQQPGWRLDLIVGAVTGPLLTPDASEPGPDAIQEMLSQAEGLARAEQLLGSGVLACAALEAVLRRAARELRLPAEELSAGSLNETLCYQGVLSQEEYAVARQLLLARDTAIRGWTTHAITGDLTQGVVNLVRKLLTETQQHGFAMPGGCVPDSVEAPVT